MTGNNVDPITTPAYLQAASVLLRLCSPLFQVGAIAAVKDPSDAHYDAWFKLRRLASAFLDRNSTRLTGRDRGELAAGLKLAHELAHDLDPAGEPPVDVCHCKVAEGIRDLVDLMAADAKAGQAAA